MFDATEFVDSLNGRQDDASIEDLIKEAGGVLGNESVLRNRQRLMEVLNEQGRVIDVVVLKS